MRIVSTANHMPVSLVRAIMPSMSNQMKTKTRGRFDTTAISPFSSKNSSVAEIIKGLMEKKKGVLESKNQLVADTLDSGAGIDTIETQLDVYDKMLKSIDEQVAQTIAAEQQAAADRLKQQQPEEKAKEPTEPITTAEGTDGMAGISGTMSDITALSSNLKVMANLASMGAKAKYQAVAIKAEIRADSGYSGSIGIGKQETLAALENLSTVADANVSAGLGDIQAQTDSIETAATIPVPASEAEATQTSATPNKAEEEVPSKAETATATDVATKAKVEKYTATQAANSSAQQMAMMNVAV